MSDDFKKSLGISTLIHIGLVVLVIVVSLFSSCRFFHKKPDMMIIDLQVALPESAPEPAPEQNVQAPPKEPDQPKDIPEPTKAAPPKPKPTIEVSKKKIKLADKPAPKPKTPTLSREEIARLLKAGARISDRTVIPDNWQVQGYYQKIGDKVHRAWQAQPEKSELPPGSSAQVTLRIQRNGTVLGATLTQSSGNSKVDTSLMRAVRSISQVDPPPDQLGGGSSIEIIVYCSTDRSSGF